MDSFIEYYRQLGTANSTVTHATSINHGPGASGLRINALTVREEVRRLFPSISRQSSQVANLNSPQSSTRKGKQRKRDFKEAFLEFKRDVILLKSTRTTTSYNSQQKATAFQDEWLRNSRIFEGPDNEKSLRYSTELLEKKDYFEVGRIISLAIVHAGLGPRINKRLTTCASSTAPTNASERSVQDIALENSFDWSDVQISFLLEPKFADFDLKTLLSTTSGGCSVLNYYHSHGHLEEKHRNRLVDVVIRHIFNVIVKTRLAHQDYNILASKIISLFPSETDSTYYIPAVRKENSSVGKSIPAKGKLVCKARNSVYVSEQCKKGQKRSIENTDDEVSTDADINDDLNEDVIWLQRNNEPWQTINLDFEKLYPEANLNLYLNFEAVFNKILELKRSSLKDDVPLQMLDRIDKLDGQDQIFLPYLIPPTGRKVAKRDHWKCSTLEVLNSIVTLEQHNAKFLKPVSVKLGASADEKRGSQHVSLVLKDRFAAFLPMRKTLTDYL
ncbi:unnamed protein product [Brassicogethes aeneus]|uniref:Uncharacterized protein n=1 Tax=Brassicogethes aeneus TaxID=1431903 RepID=A0A9P0FNN0_BRAAE|nr:unnamed protein product [Brassicogethes aeneus]